MNFKDTRVNGQLPDHTQLTAEIFQSVLDDKPLVKQYYFIKGIHRIHRDEKKDTGKFTSKRDRKNHRDSIVERKANSCGNSKPTSSHWKQQKWCSIGSVELHRSFVLLTYGPLLRIFMR